MPDYYALTDQPLPKALHGADPDSSIRTITERERLAIEDYLFNQNIKTTVNPDTTAVVVSQSLLPGVTMQDFAVLIEFAVGLLTISGFRPVTTVAAFNSSNCTGAFQRRSDVSGFAAIFPKKLKTVAANAWIHHFFAARRNSKDRMHITADRFVRYSSAQSSSDSLVDLCICLESLLDSQTEISFRFGTCLSKVTGLSGTEAQNVSGLLSQLYNFRSKVVHGADARKEHTSIDAHVVTLRQVARRILTTYVLYLSEHTREEWIRHLHNSLFN